MSLVGKNLVYLLVSQLATWSVTLIVLVIAPNVLGADNFGKIAFAGAFIQFFTLAASSGTALYLTRAVARDHDLLGRYTFNAFAVKSIMVVGASVTAVVVAWALGNRGDTLAIIAIGCVTMCFSVVN